MKDLFIDVLLVLALTSGIAEVCCREPYDPTSYHRESCEKTCRPRIAVVVTEGPEEQWQCWCEGP